MSAKAGKRPLRSLTAHEKLDAIRRVHEGESKASVARDIGVPESTLRGWCKNEDKISYLSRQASPENEDGERLEKRPKVEENLQPYNLCLRTPENAPEDLRVPSSADADRSKSAADLSMKADTPKSTSHISERERNRAELARLSVELGLNRPEIFLPGLNTTNPIDLSSNVSLLAQWNGILLQQQLLQKQPSKKTPPDGLLTTVKPEKPKPEQPKKPQSVEDSMWYWLKTQQAMLLATSPSATTSSLPTTLPSSNEIPTPTTSANSIDHNYSWFWKWYKQLPSAQQQAQLPPDKPILYQQLTKNKDNNNAENSAPAEDIRNPKARAVLDNLLWNNNNVDANAKADAKVLSKYEALEHGEKFLSWMETCSEPCVSAMQILQFRGLLNNIRDGTGRKNGDVNGKAKVKRK